MALTDIVAPADNAIVITLGGDETGTLEDISADGKNFIEIPLTQNGSSESEDFVYLG